MAIPVLTPAADAPGPFIPGQTITGTWTVADADNSSEVITFSGHDSQGNVVGGSLMIQRQDTFVMDTVVWERTGASLTFNNATRTFSGTVPSV